MAHAVSPRTVKGFLSIAASVSLLIAPTIYAAVDVTWGLKGQDVSGSNSIYASTATGGTYTYTGNDGDTNASNNVSVKISGWAQHYDDRIYNHNSQLIHYGSGLGLYHQYNDGDHEIDNAGYQEFIVFHFDEPVSLSTYSFGWVDTDADSTVLAYDPNGDGLHTGSETNSDLGLTSSDSVSDLLTNGWDAIGHYEGNSSAPQSIDISSDTADIFSRYWIIGAYLSDITPLLSGGSYKKDAFKLASLGVMREPTDTPDGETPAPSSAYLLLIGLAVFARRKYLHVR